jgi:lipoate-protein ligase A
VSDATAALFEITRVRALTVPTIGVLHRGTTLVVLGSTQHAEDLDEEALLRDGVETRRRRGGGGAVLLRPEDCWVELWLPASTAMEHGDLRSTAVRVGGWWSVALAGLGVATKVLDGGVVDGAQGAVACFAGIGPGELTAEGRKLVGLSQWRAREGALISSVLATSPPGALATYLSSSVPATPGLPAATCLDEVLPGVAVEAVSDAFVATVHRSVNSLTVSAEPFA